VVLTLAWQLAEDLHLMQGQVMVSMEALAGAWILNLAGGCKGWFMVGWCGMVGIQIFLNSW
jgi:hypothetical protein